MKRYLTDDEIGTREAAHLLNLVGIVLLLDSIVNIIVTPRSVNDTTESRVVEFISGLGLFAVH